MTSGVILKKTKKGFTKQQWTALVSGFVLMLLSGLVNGWSIFVEPIEQELNLLRQDTSLVFTISLSVSIGGQMLAGLLSRKINRKYIFWLAAAFSLAGFVGTSFAGGIWTIYFFYGIFSGLAIGMIYNLVLSSVTVLFSENLSLVSGILLMGFGIGPLVLGVGAGFLINITGWRYTFRILAFVYVVLLVIASFLLSASKNDEIKTSGSDDGISTLQMVKTRSYQFFFAWCVMLGSATLILIGHSSLISRDIGASVGVASLMTGVISVSSGVSRVVFGYVADKLGGKILKNILNLCGFLGCTAVLLGYMFSSLALLIAGYVLAGSANGGNAVYICDFIQNKYGKAHYGMNMAVTNIYMMLGSVVGTALAGSIKTQTGSYLVAFFVMMAYVTLGIVFSVLIDKADNPAKKNDILH